MQWRPDWLIFRYISQEHLPLYVLQTWYYLVLCTCLGKCIEHRPWFFARCLTHHRKNSRWLAVMASIINDRSVITYSLLVQLKIKSAMIQQQKSNDENSTGLWYDEHNSASMTFEWLWRNNWCDVIATNFIGFYYQGCKRYLKSGMSLNVCTDSFTL